MSSLLKNIIIIIINNSSFILTLVRNENWSIVERSRLFLLSCRMTIIFCKGSAIQTESNIGKAAFKSSQNTFYVNTSEKIRCFEEQKYYYY